MVGGVWWHCSVITLLFTGVTVGFSQVNLYGDTLRAQLLSTLRCGLLFLVAIAMGLALKPYFYLSTLVLLLGVFFAFSVGSLGPKWTFHPVIAVVLYMLVTEITVPEAMMDPWELQLGLLLLGLSLAVVARLIVIPGYTVKTPVSTPTAFSPTASNQVKVATQALLATTLALSITSYFHLSRGYWAVMTVLLLISSSWNSGFIRGVKRVLMTILGCLLGWFLSLILPEVQWVYVVAILTMGVLAFYFMNGSYSLSIICVTVSVVLIFGLMGQGGWSLLMARILETALGAGIVILVSRVVFPLQASTQFCARVQRLMERIRPFSEGSFQGFGREQRGAFFREIEACEILLKETRYESLRAFRLYAIRQTLLQQLKMLVHYPDKPQAFLEISEWAAKADINKDSTHG